MNLLTETTPGDTYYNGPLDPAVAMATDERILTCGRTPSGTWWAHLHDLPPYYAMCEWGTDADPEKALRYALGALFGPIDEEYDEADLRRALDVHAKKGEGRG